MVLESLSGLVNDMEILFEGELKSSSLKWREGLGHHSSAWGGCLLM